MITAMAKNIAVRVNKRQFVHISSWRKRWVISIWKRRQKAKRTKKNIAAEVQAQFNEFSLTEQTIRPRIAYEWNRKTDQK